MLERAILIDFDDTLYNTALFKTELFALVATMHIPHAHILEAYRKAKKQLFTLESFSDNVCNNVKDAELLKRNALNLIQTRTFLNRYSLAFLRCAFRQYALYICTYGDEAFQYQKITSSGILKYISGVYVSRNSLKTDIFQGFADAAQYKTVLVIDNNQAVCTEAARYNFLAMHFSTHNNFSTLARFICNQ